MSIWFLYNTWSSRNRSTSFGCADAPGAWPWACPAGFEETDMKCVPVISPPPALGTIGGYHLFAEAVKFHNCFFLLVPKF
jgi:hypothetical protein